MKEEREKNVKSNIFEGAEKKNSYTLAEGGYIDKEVQIIKDHIEAPPSLIEPYENRFHRLLKSHPAPLSKIQISVHKLIITLFEGTDFSFPKKNPNFQIRYVEKEGFLITEDPESSTFLPSSKLHESEQAPKKRRKLRINMRTKDRFAEFLIQDLGVVLHKFPK